MRPSPTGSRSGTWWSPGRSPVTPRTGSGSGEQWHDDGYMMATWFQGPKEDFIRVSQEGYAKGVNILHYTGASQATVRGDPGRSRRPG